MIHPVLWHHRWYRKPELSLSCPHQSAPSVSTKFTQSVSGLEPFRSRERQTGGSGLSSAPTRGITGHTGNHTLCLE